MKTVLAIVESPKGSNHKYDYDETLKRFKLNKILPAGLSFPFDFGYIPDTKGQDGDPLDIVIISEISSYPGCAIDCRMVGAFVAEQTERDGSTMRNDRFVEVPYVSQLFSNVNDLVDLPEAIVNQLKSFFENYNQQAGKTFEIVERISAEEAYRLVNVNN